MAEEALQAELVKAREGTLPDSRARSGRTFGEARAEWLRYVEHDRQRTRSTVRDYRNTTGKIQKHFGADTPIEKITAERIERYRAELLDGELTRRTGQKILVLLHGIIPSQASRLDSREPRGGCRQDRRSGARGVQRARAGTSGGRRAARERPNVRGAVSGGRVHGPALPG